jgi:DNA-binding transcriptional regulator YiaG
MKTQWARAVAGWREKHGLTQAAAAAALNVSQRTIENWEQGLYTPRGPALETLDRKLLAPPIKPSKPPKKGPTT